MGLAQLLPAIDPLLPEPGVAEEPRPPCAAKEWAGVPLTGIVITAISRAEGAVEVPMGAEGDFSVAGFVKKGAEHQRVHIAAEDLENMEIDPGIHVDIGAVAQD